MPQSDFLDPRWQKFRLKRLEIAGWQCEKCLTDERTLHVHHVFYIPGRKPWEYLLECTVVLCDECHEEEHMGNDFEVVGPRVWERVMAMFIQERLPQSGFDLQTLFDMEAEARER